MSCTAPAPQNLNGPNFKPGKCRYKCEYKFNYPLTDLRVTSNNDLGFFNFKVDPEHSPAVEYGSAKYNAIGFHLYNKPIHNYGSKDITGEVVIIHKASSGTSTISNLYVCIPVKTVDNTSGHVLDDLLSYISNSGSPLPPDNPEECPVMDPNSTSCGLLVQKRNFKLSKIVPEKEYVVYQGTDFVNLNCTTPNTEYIVFKNINSALIISSNQAKTSGFTKLTKDHNLPVVNKNADFFFAGDFVPGTSMEDDIYIDCKPVETSSTKKKLTPVTTGPPAFLSSLSLGDIFKSAYKYIFVIIGVLLMIAMWKFGNYLYGPKCGPGKGKPNCPNPPSPPLECPE